MTKNKIITVETNIDSSLDKVWKLWTQRNRSTSKNGTTPWFVKYWKSERSHFKQALK